MDASRLLFFRCLLSVIQYSFKRPDTQVVKGVSIRLTSFFPPSLPPSGASYPFRNIWPA